MAITELAGFSLILLCNNSLKLHYDPANFQIFFILKNISIYQYNNKTGYRTSKKLNREMVVILQQADSDYLLLDNKEMKGSSQLWESFSNQYELAYFLTCVKLFYYRNKFKL